VSRPSIPNTFTSERKAIFLAVLEETASPKAAAAAAGVVRSTAFYHRRNDLEFAAAWEAAVEVALDALLEEAYRRSVIGHDEPLVHQGRLSTVTDPVTGEERVQTIRKYSDRLMEVLLKWRYPQMADRLSVKVDSTGLDAEALLAMPAAERAQLTALLAKYAANKPEEKNDDQ
jgi:hypothetical protein